MSVLAVKLALTALSVLVQLAATVILLFAATGAVTTILGDSGDGTFKPTTLRTLQGCFTFALFFAAWTAVLFVTIRGEIRMWRSRNNVFGRGEPRQR